MEKRLFLLDGMALAYRAHFAFIVRPIRTSKGVNTSALFGFASTILDLVEREKPTHMAVVFDTDAPTERHRVFPAYKANRDEMPEDLAAALPHLRRFAVAFGLPAIAMDGYEADDVIGTLARQAEAEGFETWMVTPDKDYGQLVTERSRIYKPGTKGDAPERLGVAEVLERWQIRRVEQVIDMLGLIGDATDNIPGVPGVGPKTAQKLIEEFDTLENALARAGEIKGKLGPKLLEFREQALLSKRLATIDRAVPVVLEPEALALGRPRTEELRALLAEFEFRSLAQRALGSAAALASSVVAPASGTQGELFATSAAEPTAVEGSATVSAGPPPGDQLELGVAKRHRTIAEVAHDYTHVHDEAGRAVLAAKLAGLEAFCFDTETDGLEPRHARLVGLSFAWKDHEACFVRLPEDPGAATAALEVFRPVFENPAIEKAGHNLKFDLAVLRAAGIRVAGPFFDTMLAHTLVDPDQRHGMDYLAEVLLDYTPIPISSLIGDGSAAPQTPVSQVDPEALATYAAEDADVTWQLRRVLAPMLAERGQERVFREVEMPLLPVLVDMEHEGIALDTAVLGGIGEHLAAQAGVLEQRVFELVGRPFNLASPKQLGEILFDELKIAEKPKKTRTGQYATNEQTLLQLAGLHPVVQTILDHREVVKLKNTYVDALPSQVDTATGRVHTHFSQLRTATGRLASDNPNLQNIPIRSAQGREIRRAFVARGPEWALLSADYSQIELRIIAALSQDPGMLEAFAAGQDIHTATAARVYGVAEGDVTREMRARAKMVNFGIPYGISAFGLAQRLGCSRTEATELIDGYFRQFAGIRGFIDATLESCRRLGYVETVTGRRRYLPDINSGNGATRSGAERNAINTPIQGSAADMIKIAMSLIHADLAREGLRSRLLLQVHDELLFDLFRPEEETLRTIVETRMKTALPLRVPMHVEIGIGSNWLEAH
ncbi:DNA polymerase I [Congregicoccus parvus]|uniref:DNA polymerase I n=1 Tax=Congregicoccus parvus TaxID=3081749 RepID=UPI003FA53DDF